MLHDSYISDYEMEAKFWNKTKQEEKNVVQSVGRYFFSRNKEWVSSSRTKTKVETKKNINLNEILFFFVMDVSKYYKVCKQS